MQVPEFWRAPNNKLYRIRREDRPLQEAPGRVYTIRAFALSDDSALAAEASVSLREADLLEKVRLTQRVPTPEQLYVEAFQAVISQLAR